MQVGRWVAGAALLVSLAGCDRREAPSPAAATPPAASGQQEVASDGSGATAPAAPQVEAKAHPAVDGAAPKPVPLEELKVGLSREQLLATVGDCVDRVKLITPTPARQSLEVFQPRDQDCQKQLGERHFVVLGDRLASINPGLRRKVEAARRSPPAEDASARPR